ncbi:MAG: anti-sigma factor family protein [Blastocatellia bacterium]
MNCENFENIVNDLARAKMPTLMDAVARERGLAHAETCERCADRLADERALTSGLKALSASDEEKAAPDRVEAALLAAFRQQPIREHISHRWPRWALAAAVILVALGLIIYRALNNASSEKSKDDQVLAPPTPAPEPVERKINEPVIDRKLAGNKSARPGGTRWHLVPRPRPRAPRFLIRDEITLYARDSEVTSEFFPLTYEEEPAPMESGQLIRVQMPRSALVSFGLPVNVERADAPVTADLLVGEDGLARAIRFVR